MVCIYETRFWEEKRAGRLAKSCTQPEVHTQQHVPRAGPFLLAALAHVKRESSRMGVFGPSYYSKGARTGMRVIWASSTVDAPTVCGGEQAWPPLRFPRRLVCMCRMSMPVEYPQAVVY